MELLLVLAIISMVIGTMKVHVQKQKIQAEARNIVERVKVYQAAITMYYLRNGGNFPVLESTLLENNPKLKPYYPAGFKSKGADIKIAGFLSVSMQCSDSYCRIIVDITGRKDLANEVYKQLKEFALDAQVVQSYHDASNTQLIFFYLKKNNTIYI